MKNEDTNEAAATETITAETDAEEAAEAQDGKLLLGKRVLRHFGVRSNVQAGTQSLTITKRTR